MPRLLRISFSIMAVCCIGLAGYVFGYLQGYLGGRGDPAVAEAMSNVEILTALRDRKYDEAIYRLEISLDARVIERAAYLSSNFQLAPLFSVQHNAEEFSRKIRAYRRAHPSVAEDREVREVVERALSAW